MKPIRNLGSWTMGLLAANVLTDLASIGSKVMQNALLDRMSRGDFTMAEADANDLREAMINWGAVALYVATGIVFLTWFHRAYANLDAYGHERAHTTGWAVGAWFVPFMNLVRPYSMTKEMWSATDVGAESSGGVRGSMLLVAWWGSWLLGNVVGQITFRMNQESISEIQTATSIAELGSAVSIIGAILALLVVREITRRQTAFVSPSEPAAPTSF